MASGASVPPRVGTFRALWFQPERTAIGAIVVLLACAQVWLAVRLNINWDGSEMLLQSRAVDETGYVQPTKDALRAIRGLNNVYHNNGIQTWWVHENGEVENVEVA